MLPRQINFSWLIRLHIRMALRWHWLVLSLAVLMTLLAAHYARQIDFRASFTDLLPEDSPTIQALHEVSRKIGGVGYVTLLVHSPHLEKARAFVQELAIALERLPQVRYVNYRIETEFYKKYFPLFMDLEDLQDILTRLETKRDFERLRANPFYFSLDEKEDKAKSELHFDDIIDKYRQRNQTLRFDQDGWFVNQEGNITLVLVKPDNIASDIAYSRRLVQAVQDTVTQVNPQRFDPTMRIEYTDRYVIRPLEQDAIQADLRVATVLALIGVVLLMTLYTRKLRTIVVIGVPLIMGVIWTFGFASLTLGHVNLITGFLLAILMGLGIDYGIHIFCRFLEDRQLGIAIPEAITNIYRHTARSSLTACVTSSVAFYTLMFTEFRGFSEFGFIAGTGLLLCLLAMVYVLPCLLVLGEKFFPLLPQPHLQQRETVLQNRRFPRPLWTLGFFLGAIVLCGFFSSSVEMEYDFKNLQVKGLPELKRQDIANKTMGISLTPNAIVAYDYREAEEILDIITRIQDNVRAQGQVPAIAKALSLPSLIPSQQEEKRQILEDIRAILNDKGFKTAKWQDQADIQLFRESLQHTVLRPHDIPASIKRTFSSVDGSGNYIVWVFPGVSLSDARAVDRFVNEMRQINDYKKDRPVKLSGEAFVFSEILALVEKDIALAVISTLVVVFMILLLDFRNLRDVLIVFTPLVTGLLLTLGVMVLTHTKANFVNLVIFPSLIGLGVDNGVYLYSRYRENGSRQVMRVLWSTGAATCLTTLTSVSGFGTLLLARHGALYSFGLLAVIGLSAGLVAALVMFPALLQWLEDRQTAPIASR